MVHALLNGKLQEKGSMKMWEYLFPKKNQAGAATGENIMAMARTILTNSETIINRIFDDHKMGLLDKDPDYVIYSIFGMNVKRALTEEQMAIHRKIDPVICRMIDALEIQHLSASQKMAILFIVRLMMAHKLLFMIELFKNETSRQSAQKQHIQKMLKEMETVGHA